MASIIATSVLSHKGGADMVDLILTALTMLLDKEQETWRHYGCDGQEWWQLRLWTRIN